MNNFERCLQILQEDVTESDSLIILNKILNSTRITPTLNFINRKFPLSDTDTLELNKIVWNLKLNESKRYQDNALNIINWIVGDKNIDNELKRIETLKQYIIRYIDKSLKFNIKTEEQLRKIASNLIY